jgi:triosephosphate isomerase
MINMVRKKIVAGNWKMNTDLKEAMALTSELIDEVREVSPHVILFPPFPYLRTLFRLIHENSPVRLGAQNCHHEDSGAYTGEVSAVMLKSLGIHYVIVGHSERRQYFGETNEMLLAKTRKVLANDMIPIFCCGEPLEEREAGTHEAFVKEQLKGTILKLSPSEIEKVILAYEPVWAIGTGKTASPQQAQDMHAFIRSTVGGTFSDHQAATIPILYGGSVKPGNARSLFEQEDVDGGLVGGASLSPEQFLSIVRSF